MVLNRFDKNMSIIAALDDEPNDVGGLSATELKAKFDEGGEALQEYINQVLIPQLEALGVEVTIYRGDESLRYLRLREDRRLEASVDGKTYYVVSGGHRISSGNNIAAQRDVLEFPNSEVQDDGLATVIRARPAWNEVQGKPFYGEQVDLFVWSEGYVPLDWRGYNNERGWYKVSETPLTREQLLTANVGYRLSDGTTGTVKVTDDLIEELKSGNVLSVDLGDYVTIYTGLELCSVFTTCDVGLDGIDPLDVGVWVGYDSPGVGDTITNLSVERNVKIDKELLPKIEKEDLPPVPWAVIENKPFEDNSILETYDFAVQGVPTVTFKDYIAADQPRYYKISNLTLSHDELLKTVFTYTRNGEVTGSETVTESSFEISNESISVLSVAGQRFLVAYTSGAVGIDHGYAAGTITVPETGLYISGLIPTVFNNCTATINYIDIEKLDEKFLPEDYAASSADSVKFTKDLITTFEIGNISLENGQAVIPAKGKSLQDVWDTIFVKELLPTVEEPKVTLTAAECKAYEVGTKVTPTYSAVLSEGAYEYGPATGIRATWWTVSNSNKEMDVMQDSTIVGAFKEITVGDDTNYHITAIAEHGEGEIPVTNLGNEYPDGRIAAGTKEATSAKITGYRNGFYGTAVDKEAAIDSSFVRSLASKSGKTPAAGNVWNLAIPVGAMRIAFAYPATIRDVSSVLDVNGLNAEIKSSFTKHTVSVEGANGYDGIDYKVYVLDRAAAVTEANTFKITI